MADKHGAAGFMDSSSVSRNSAIAASSTPESERSRIQALLVACATIALERFAFYLVFSLYTLCLVERHRFTAAQAATHYGVFIGLSYFTPLLGGPIADRFGRWSTVAVSGVFLSISYFLLMSATQLIPFLFLFSLGSGLFKGNITSTVGALFPNEAERDTAYSRFYLAINLGSLPAGFFGAWLVPKHGYGAAFLVSGLACLLATLLWSIARRLLSIHPQQSRRHHDAADRERIIALLVLLPVPVTFFFVFHQSGSSLTLFASDHTLPTLLGIKLNPPVYQSLQSLRFRIAGRPIALDFNGAFGCDQNVGRRQFLYVLEDRVRGERKPECKNLIECEQIGLPRDAGNFEQAFHFRRECKAIVALGVEKGANADPVSCQYECFVA